MADPEGCYNIINAIIGQAQSDLSILPRVNMHKSSVFFGEDFSTIVVQSYSSL